jgi:hypothetical protein
VLSRRILLCGLSALALGTPFPAFPIQAQTASQGRDPEFRTFTPTGYPVPFTYPAAIFERSDRADDSGLIRFVSRDGRATIHLSNAPNDRRLTTKAVMGAAEAALRNQQVTGSYRRLESNWFVLSGLIGEEIFYYKVVLSRAGSEITTFQILYPKDRRAEYDELVKVMSRSLQPGS